MIKINSKKPIATIMSAKRFIGAYISPINKGGNKERKDQW